MITVKTPFGIGFATDQADYEKMMYFVEGAKAALEFSGTVISPEEVEDEDLDLEEPTQAGELRNKVQDWAANKEEYPSLREIWRKVDREIREKYSDITDKEAEDIVDYVDSLRSED